MSIREPTQGVLEVLTKQIRTDAPPSSWSAAAYGGINAAKALDDVAHVTLVDRRKRSSTTFAAWRALVEPEVARSGSFSRTRSCSPTVAFVQGLYPVAPRRRRNAGPLASGEGARARLPRARHRAPRIRFPAKTEGPRCSTPARRRFHAAHEALLAAQRVLIVGAGSIPGSSSRGRSKSSIRQAGDDRGRSLTTSSTGPSRPKPSVTKLRASAR